MDADSLKFMLDIGETIAVEFKRCGNGITNDVYETVRSVYKELQADRETGC
jgi:hypothetical protein